VTLFIALAGRMNKPRASQVVGLVAVTIAAAALVGWWAGLPLLTNWGSGLPATRPLGALCLAVLGVALVHPGKDSLLALVAGVAVATLALVGLALVLFNVLTLASSTARWCPRRQYRH
jgi:small neutral amino acid transporter SnatA (MarC family)